MAALILFEVPIPHFGEIIDSWGCNVVIGSLEVFFFGDVRCCFVGNCTWWRDILFLKVLICAYIVPV